MRCYKNIRVASKPATITIIIKYYKNVSKFILKNNEENTLTKSYGKLFQDLTPKKSCRTSFTYHRVLGLKSL